MIDLLLAKGIVPGSDLFLKRLLRAFVFATGCFVPILPVTWHNVQQGGDFVLIGSSGGVNFYIGNNPQADGLHSLFPDMGANWDVPFASLEAYRAEGRILKSSEVSNHYYKRGWNYVVANPVEAGTLLLRKFFAFWNRREISNNRDLYFFVNETRIMPFLRLLGFWLIGPLGLLGFWISIRKKLLPAWFICLLPVYMLGVIAFFVTARFRIPALPFLLIFAGIALHAMWTHRRSLLSREWITNIAVFILFLLFVNTSPWQFSWDSVAHAHYSLGNAHLKKGNLDAAKQAYAWALRADSTYALVHLNLGVVAYREGDYQRAEAEYLRELANNPSLAMAYNNLGVLRFEQGRFEEARQYYEKALQLQPYFEDARLNLAESFFKQGLEEAESGLVQQAADKFGRAIQLNENNALYHYNYALALGRMGYTDTAMNHLQEALKIAPDFPEARSLLRQITNQMSGSSQLSP
jgi:Tfp pilus assembly protein PilF